MLDGAKGGARPHVALRPRGSPRQSSGAPRAGSSRGALDERSHTTAPGLQMLHRVL